MNGNIRFALSQKKDLLDQYFHIRYERYVEEMGAEKANSARLEIDMYDDKSYFIIILKEGEVIGGCRLVDKRKTNLPVEEFLYPFFQLPKSCVEISRYTLKRDCGLSHSEKIEVQRACNDFITALGIIGGFDSFCANIRTLCARWQKRIDNGLKMTVIGEVNEHPGAGKLIPVMFSR